MTRPPQPSFFANAEAARQALQMVLPMIEPQMTNRDVCGSGFLYIVIMDPALQPGEVSFQEAVLLEHAVGDRSKWDADYASFARAKAKGCWEHGMGGHQLQSLMPYRLREGDSLLWGGVNLDGIVVGVSGAHPYYDEAFATAIAGCLKAVAKERWQKAVDSRQLFASKP